MKVIAMASKMLAIVAGVIAVAGIFAAYAIIGVGKDITNGNGITVNEEKRGNGTVDTLSFKNPVTIRLIDKNGNVASETVVYNDITDDGKAYIYQVLGDPAASVSALDFIRFFDTGTDAPTADAFLDPDGSTVVSVTNDTETCTPNATATEATCEATFTFDVPGGYTPSADGDLTLNTDVHIQTGNGTTPYFELDSMTVPVDDNTTYTTIKITWTITVT
jgi:hypothetical protein